MGFRKDMKQLVMRAKKRGWIELGTPHSSNHYQLEWLDRTVVRASRTPSCHHAIRNALADLIKVEKQSTK